MLGKILVLIGILSVALITAGTTIVNHLAGQAVEAVQLRPVAAYAGLMVVLCLALAWRHEVDWHLSGRCSELLRTEAHAARIDGLISGVAGAALLGAPLRALVPVADSVLVLALALLVLPEPLQQFWRALRQTAGARWRPGSDRTHQSGGKGAAQRHVDLAARSHRDEGGPHHLCGGLPEPRHARGWPLARSPA